MSSPVHRASRLLRTITPLTSKQIAYRLWYVLRNRFRYYAATRVSSRPSPRAHSISATWTFASDVSGIQEVQDSVREGRKIALQVCDGTFTFLNQELRFASEINWTVPGMPRLWRFHLHYFEYVRYLVLLGDSGYKPFRLLCLSWVEGNKLLQGDGWHAYTISLRLRNWIEGLVFWRNLVTADQAFQSAIHDSIYCQARILRRGLEFDLRGNHLLENLRTLVWVGILFEGKETESWLRLGLTVLRAEVSEQVLPDGGHFERTPGYHIVVLRLLLDVALLLQHNNRSIPSWLIDAIGRATDFLEAIATPNGRVPLLKDTGCAEGARDVGFIATKWLNRKPSPIFRPGLESALTLGSNAFITSTTSVPLPLPAIAALPHTGYYVLKGLNNYTIIDCGRLAPDYLPGHAHADTFNFEYWGNGVPLVVDSGVCEYEAGALRDYFRSTRAHNTVEIDGSSSSEMWGSFRVGRRAKVKMEYSLLAGDQAVVLASHSGYSHLDGGVKHRRCFLWRADDYLVIVDWIVGGGIHSVASNVHLHPSATLAKLGEFKWRINGGEAEVFLAHSGSGWNSELTRGWYSPAYGVRQTNEVIAFRIQSSLPLCSAYVLSLRSDVTIACRGNPGQLTVELVTGGCREAFAISAHSVSKVVA